MALPRSQEAGKLQEQMSKQNQRFQESLVQSQLKEEVKKRKSVNEFEKLAKAEIKDRDANSEKDSANKRENEAQLGKEEETLAHPYLGSKIDFSG